MTAISALVVGLAFAFVVWDLGKRAIDRRGWESALQRAESSAALAKEHAVTAMAEARSARESADRATGLEERTRLLEQRVGAARAQGLIAGR